MASRSHSHLSVLFFPVQLSEKSSVFPILGQNSKSQPNSSWDQQDNLGGFFFWPGDLLLDINSALETNLNTIYSVSGSINVGHRMD